MRWVIVPALALSLIGSVTVAAQPPNKGKGKGKGKSEPTQVTVVINGTQRDAVRSYFVEKHGRGNCPPGLDKKNNGCLPPGQAKKRYSVGHSLPRGIVLAELPADLAVRIGTAPSGHRYAIVDGDLIMLAVGTMMVVDAIEGLVR